MSPHANYMHNEDSMQNYMKKSSSIIGGGNDLMNRIQQIEKAEQLRQNDVF